MRPDKPPRRRNERCDYCNTDKGGLAAFCNRVHVFCGPICEATSENCVYYRHLDRPPDQFERLPPKPPIPCRQTGNGRTQEPCRTSSPTSQLTSPSTSPARGMLFCQSRRAAVLQLSPLSTGRTSSSPLSEQDLEGTYSLLQGHRSNRRRSMPTNPAIGPNPTRGFAY
jgi:hypothetical protein